MTESLYWEASFAIAKALQAKYPKVALEDVSLKMVLEWTLALPGFSDDPELASDEILYDIYQNWLEEVLVEGE